jgi:predicted enzyme related to lactoylglutathione lyase
VPSDPGCQGFQYGDQTLWLDRVEHAAHPEVWLELTTDDLDAGAELIAKAGGRVADEIEPLEGRRAHWIIDPAGVVLLLSTLKGTATKDLA